jgi:hypothetical protein
MKITIFYKYFVVYYFAFVQLQCTLLTYFCFLSYKPGNTKGGSITVPLTSSLTGLD